jgi:hypothetical protein
MLELCYLGDTIQIQWFQNCIINRIAEVVTLRDSIVVAAYPAKAYLVLGSGEEVFSHIQEYMAELPSRKFFGGAPSLTTSTTRYHTYEALR